MRFLPAYVLAPSLSQTKLVRRGSSKVLLYVRGLESLGCGARCCGCNRWRNAAALLRDVTWLKNACVSSGALSSLSWRCGPGRCGLRARTTFGLGGCVASRASRDEQNEGWRREEGPCARQSVLGTCGLEAIVTHAGSFLRSRVRGDVGEGEKVVWGPHPSPR